jgi:hypothetical protein
LFSLTNKDKFEIYNEKFAIAFPPNYGPTFIGTNKYDFAIADRAYKNKNSICLKAGNYRNLKY